MELGPGENDGGETNFEGAADALLNEGGATLVSMATDPMGLGLGLGYKRHVTNQLECLHYFYFKLTF